MKSLEFSWNQDDRSPYYFLCQIKFTQTFNLTILASALGLKSVVIAKAADEKKGKNIFWKYDSYV